jgi:Periplasmic copper-binding protein (NosD)
LAPLRSLVVLAALAAALVLPHSASAASLACGATLTSDTTLSRDLTGCAGTALTIGADRVRLDLGGHTVDGAILAQGHARVRIVNGVVNGEVRLEDVRRAVVRRLAVEGGSIFCIGSAGCAISQNTVAGGGIAIAESEPGAVNVIRWNAVRDAPLAAIAVDRSDSTTVAENIARRSAIGIESSHAADIRIAGNLIVDNQGDGISGSFGSAARLAGNTIVTNGGDGISLRMWGGDTVIARNLLFKNGRAGILGATVAHWLVARNTAIANGTSGIAITGSSSDAVLKANTAIANGATGIFAADGVTDGGRNHAQDNAGAQCSGVTCN